MLTKVPRLGDTITPHNNPNKIFIVVSKEIKRTSSELIFELEDLDTGHLCPNINLSQIMWNFTKLKD